MRRSLMLGGLGRNRQAAAGGVAFLVGADGDTPGAGNSLPLSTVEVDTTGASLIVVATSTLNAASPSIVDNYGNTWTQLTGYLGGIRQQTLHYCLAPSTGSGHTFTVNSGNSYAFPGICAAAFTGTVSFASETGSTSGSTPGSLSIGGAGLYVSGITSDDNPVTTISDDYMVAAVSAIVGSTNIGTGIGYRIDATARDGDPTWASAGGSASSNVAFSSP